MTVCYMNNIVCIVRTIPKENKVKMNDSKNCLSRMKNFIYGMKSNSKITFSLMRERV